GSGKFGAWSLTYTAPSSGGQVGQALQVMLDSSGASSQTHFDNIKLYGGIATITALASSGTPSNVGSSVTFTATVTAAAGSAPTIGTVTFIDGTVTLGT